MQDTSMERWTMNRKLGAVFGATYILVGLLGFAVTQNVDFAAREGDHLLGIFEVNPLHNIAHILIGAALLLAAMKNDMVSRAVNGTVGATYLLLGVLGLFLLDSEADILALNHADNLLHLASAAVLLGVALSGRNSTTMSDRRTGSRISA